MTKTDQTFLKILRGLVYTLGVITLILGILGGLSLISMSSALPNMLISLQALGLGVFSDLLTSLLRPVFINLGIATLLISLVMSLLALAAGRLIGLSLEMNQRLENQSRQLEEVRSQLAGSVRGAETHA